MKFIHLLWIAILSILLNGCTKSLYINNSESNKEAHLMFKDEIKYTVKNIVNVSTFGNPSNYKTTQTITKYLSEDVCKEFVYTHLDLDSKSANGRMTYNYSNSASDSIQKYNSCKLIKTKDLNFHWCANEKYITTNSYDPKQKDIISLNNNIDCFFDILNKNHIQKSIETIMTFNTTNGNYFGEIINTETKSKTYTMNVHNKCKSFNIEIVLNNDKSYGKILTEKQSYNPKFKINVYKNKYGVFFTGYDINELYLTGTLQTNDTITGFWQNKQCMGKFVLFKTDDLINSK